MTYNKECMESLIRFIEESLSFTGDEMEATHLDIAGVHLEDFMNIRSPYPMDEVKYCYLLLLELKCITIKQNVGGNSPFISGFTEKGYEMLLKYIHK